MKMNKKGMTLLELIISIALLSVVLGFLFKILLDVKYENEHAGYATSNQINRAEIIRTIQEDILEYGISSNGGISTYNLEAFIMYNHQTDLIYGTIKVSPDKKTLTYTFEREMYDELGEYLDTKRNIKTWKIKDENFKFGKPRDESLENSCYFKIVIPVEDGISNNIIDDIVIVGKNGWC